MLSAAALLRGWVLGLTLATGSLVVATAASAAPYQVSACGGPGGAFNQLWIRSNNAPDYLDMSQNCPASGRESGLLVQDATGGGLRTPAGARAEWVFTAPPGTSVSAISYGRWMAAIGDAGWLTYLRDGGGNLLESCSPADGPFSCELGTPGDVGKPAAAARTLAGLQAGALAIGVTCTSLAGCANGADSSLHNAGVALQGASVTLEDLSPPQIAAASGSLTDTQDVITGPAALTVSAADRGGGVGRLAVRAGGATLGTLALGCDYTRPVPCPATTTQTLSVDPTQIGDGLVPISVVADDATYPWSGANQVAGPAWTVRVDGTAPGPAASFSTLPQMVRAGQAFQLSWGSLGDGYIPATEARWRLLAPDGAVVRQGTERGSGPRTIPGLVLNGPGQWRVEVTLVDQLGRIGPTATAPVTAQPAATAAVQSDPRVRLRAVHALVRIAPASHPRRFAARVVVEGHLTGAWRRRVAAHARSLMVPLPRAARRAARFRLEWRAPGGGWQRAAVRRAGGMGTPRS